MFHILRYRVMGVSLFLLKDAFQFITMKQRWENISEEF